MATDPTHTVRLRQSFTAEVNRRFNAVAKRIREFVADEDAFGLADRVVGNRSDFQFLTDQQKVKAFMDWLDALVRERVLSVSEGEPMTSANQAWTSKYIETAYQKGVADAGKKLRGAGAEVGQEWIRGAFNRPVHADRVGIIFTRAFEALEGITREMDRQISQVLAQGIAEGRNPLDIARRLTERVQKVGRTRARLLARTECLLGDTLVDSAMVSAAHRRWYDGKVVEIRTGNGRKLTATPNHPMLTQRGWVAVGEITQRDYLVCDARQEHVRTLGNQDIAGRPASIGDIFNSAAAVGVVERKGTAEPDFHGDGMEGYVDIARPDRELSVGAFTPLDKEQLKFLFTESDWTGTRFCPLSGRLLPVDQGAALCRGSHINATRPQSVRDRLFAHFVAHGKTADAFARKVFAHNFLDWQPLDVRRNTPTIGVEVFPGLGIAAEQALAPDLILDPPYRQLHRLTDFVAALTGSVLSYDCGLVAPRRLALDGGPDRVSAIPYDAKLAHSHGDPTCRSAKDGTDLGARPSGAVELDPIVETTVIAFSGHVYNLSTPEGYFTIAGGAYTGNTISAHAEASLNAYEEAGVQGVQTEAEWLTAGDSRVCPDCRRMEGRVFEISKARGMIPLHPQCRCSFIPVIKDLRGIRLNRMMAA